MPQNAISNILFSTVTTGTEKARFAFLLRRWRKKLFSETVLSMDNINARKTFINNWLAELENIFSGESAKINVLSGFSGWVSAGVGVTGSSSQEMFIQNYRDTMQALSGKDVVWSRMQRNSLAGRIKDTGVQKMYNTYDAYLAEAKGLGLTQSETVETFMNTIGKTVTTLRDSAGRLWKPENYARMYSNTRSSQMYDEIFQDELVAIGSDIVQVSDHNTTTPICQLFEGKVYSLTGDTPGYPVLPQRPPFHPNCKHVLTSRPKMKGSQARKINFKQNKQLVAKKKKWPDSANNTIKKQTDWNLENRPPKGIK